MFDGVRPFDWLMLAIEAAVLVVIVYEGVSERIRNKGRERRASMLNDRALMLSKLVGKGERLRSVVPDPSIISDPRRLVDPWMDKVEEWTKETNSYLLQHSSQASEAFLLVPDSEAIDHCVYASGRQFFLQDGALFDHYRRLCFRLENLRRIVDRPEAFF